MVSSPGRVPQSHPKGWWDWEGLSGTLSQLTGTVGTQSTILDPNLILIRENMTTCESIQTVLNRYSSIPRHRLPDWLRDPTNQHGWDCAFALVAAPHGIRPMCENGILVGWEGIGIRARERRPKQPSSWSTN